ncbi:MAG: TIGR00730 family Rossman fold protein [Saprospiraceae bacterium]
MNNHNKNIKFLEGPLSRWQEFKYLLDVCWDMFVGVRGLHFVGPCISIFGSARFGPEHPYYKITEQLAGRIASLGFTIMTGGGPGIMEAANKGAREVKGKSVGCNIKLPHEQMPNPYLDHWVTMDYFFTRNTMLIKYSYAFVVMPGGYGTMDEFFEALTLIQTGKISNFPIILFGREYHTDLIRFIDNLATQGAIQPKDKDLILITDDPEEVIRHIKNNVTIRTNLSEYNTPHANSWLFEKGI